MFFSRTFQIINLCVIAFCNIKYAKAHLPIFYCILYIIIIFYFRIKLIKKVGFWPQSMFFVKNKPKSTVFKPFLPYFKPFLVIWLFPIGLVLALYTLIIATWLFVREIPKYKSGKYVYYDSIWFEGQATNWGKKYFPQ